MKQYVIAVWDSAAQGYMNPWFSPSRGQAVRAFTDEVNRADPQNTLNRHRGDFELHLLAVFDSDTGHFEGGRPETMIRGKDIQNDAAQESVGGRAPLRDDPSSGNSAGSVLNTTYS